MNYLTPIFACLIGTLCFWMSVRLIRLYIKVRTWERVKANMIKKEMFLHPKYSTSRSPYGIRAEYTYDFNNRVYTGYRIYLAELMNGQVNHSKALAEKKMHQLESNPLIFVDPMDPQSSVIYCEGIGLYVFVFVMGLFAFLFALGSLLY